MIKFYRHPDCAECEQIQEKLNELVLAHSIVIVGQGIPDTESIPPNTAIPLLADNGNLVSGESAILKHLEELEAFKIQWDKYQSDSCYCDEEGDIE